MRQVYECGDVFKLEDSNEYYIIGRTDTGFKLFSLFDGTRYEYEGINEEGITNFINDEDFIYIGSAENVVKIIEDKINKK